MFSWSWTRREEDTTDRIHWRIVWWYWLLVMIIFSLSASIRSVSEKRKFEFLWNVQIVWSERLRQLLRRHDKYDDNDDHADACKAAAYVIAVLLLLLLLVIIITIITFIERDDSKIVQICSTLINKFWTRLSFQSYFLCCYTSICEL